MKRLLIALVFPVIILASGCNQKNEEIGLITIPSEKIRRIF